MLLLLDHIHVVLTLATEFIAFALRDLEEHRHQRTWRMDSGFHRNALHGLVGTFATAEGGRVRDDAAVLTTNWPHLAEMRCCSKAPQAPYWQIESAILGRRRDGSV